MKVKYDSLIVYTICRILIPFIQLYALYVIMHGHSSPGGGFQGGVILGASIILLAISQGTDEARKRFNNKVAVVMASTGLLIYCGIGWTALLFGGNYLDYSAIPFPGTTPVTARYIGMLGIELGVGIGVMAIMATLFLWLISFETEAKDL